MHKKKTQEEDAHEKCDVVGDARDDQQRKGERMKERKTERRKACRGQVYPSCLADKSGEVESSVHRSSLGVR